jgi:hypothetical protein
MNKAHQIVANSEGPLSGGTQRMHNRTTAAFIWLKNRDPDHWRDVQNVEHVMGKYLISDKPMTLEEWASARATVVSEVIDDAAPALPKPNDTTEKLSKTKGK